MNEENTYPEPEPISGPEPVDAGPEPEMKPPPAPVTPQEIPGGGVGTMGVPEAEPDAPTTTKSNRTLIIVLVVVGVVLLLCCCIVIVGPMIFGPGIEDVFEDIMEEMNALTYVLV
jgi:hypothetical protein